MLDALTTNPLTLALSAGSILCLSLGYLGYLRYAGPSKQSSTKKKLTREEIIEIEREKILERSRQAPAPVVPDMQEEEISSLDIAQDYATEDVSVLEGHASDTDTVWMILNYTKSETVRLRELLEPDPDSFMVILDQGVADRSANMEINSYQSGFLMSWQGDLWSSLFTVERHNESYFYEVIDPKSMRYIRSSYFNNDPDMLRGWIASVTRKYSRVFDISEASTSVTLEILRKISNHPRIKQENSNIIAISLTIMEDVGTTLTLYSLRED